MITKEEREKVVEKFGPMFGSGKNDTGSSEVQVALLTARINGLKEHFEKNIHDFHSNRGLLKMIGHRKSLLKYIKSRSEDKYKKLIKELGLRK